MSEGGKADKFLKIPLAASSARCPKRSVGTQTAGRLFFAYFLLAKQKKVSRRRATPGKPSEGEQLSIQELLAPVLIRLEQKKPLKTEKIHFLGGFQTQIT